MFQRKYYIFYSLMIQVFFIEGDNIESANQILNSELENISTCLTENKLTLNVSKSLFQ